MHIQENGDIQLLSKKNITFFFNNYLPTIYLYAYCFRLDNLFRSRLIHGWLKREDVSLEGKWFFISSRHFLLNSVPQGIDVNLDGILLCEVMGEALHVCLQTG